MQNKPIHLQLRNRDQALKVQGGANGPVTTYFLNEDELAVYRKNTRPPTDASGKKLRRPTNGGGVA